MDQKLSGKFIAARRSELGYTQKSLGDALGVTDKAVSKWERGTACPDPSILQRLAAELKVGVDELLCGERFEPSHSSNRGGEASADAAVDGGTAVVADGLIVSPELFGNNLEHTRASVLHGLAAQMLDNRKFAGKPSARCGVAAYWYPIGNAHFELDEREPYTRHSDTFYHMKRLLECASQRVSVFYEGMTGGIGQENVDVEAATDYDFAAVVRTTAAVALTVSLTSRGGKVLASKTFELGTCREWTRVECVLTPVKSDAKAQLRLTFENKCSVSFGAVSLMKKDNFLGMRRDVIATLKKIGPKVIRWPGGNFAGEYCWHDGLMPVDERAPLQSTMWLETQPFSLGYDFHEIGIDEFIAFCREIDAEPFVTINITWNTPEENAALVEYCNGAPDSRYGSIRASRGHAEPYGVRLWSLGNEMGYGHMEGDNSPRGYACLAAENARKMKEVDPSIILCSSGRYPDKRWHEDALPVIKDLAPLVSMHAYSAQLSYRYGVTEEEYYRCISGSISRARNMLIELRAALDALDRNMRISFDEWAVWYSWYKPSCPVDGIHDVAMSHMIICEAARLGIAHAGYFEMTENAMTITPRSCRLTATGQALAATHRHAGGRVLRLTDELVATEKNGVVTATAVNTSFDKPLKIKLGLGLDAAELELYYAPDMLPGHVFSVRKRKLTADSFTLPPHSFAVITSRTK